jgi:hypothetical protein
MWIERARRAIPLHDRARMGKRSLAPIAGILYLIACATPALATVNHPLFGEPQDKLLFGVHCLVAGWLVEPAWLANPLLLVAVLLLRRHRDLAMVVALGAVALGCFTLAQMAGDLRYPHVGFFLWIASMLLVMIEAMQRRDPSQR